MPYVCRLDSPGSFHHVMSHCAEGCRAFDEDRSRGDFLERIGQQVRKRQFRVHAWAIMGNHYHLLAEPVEAPLGDTMQKILTGFAKSYNIRTERRGHVFDARFRSILVEKESYFLKLVSYIHLNPLKAGMVSTLEELDRYPWTSYSYMIGNGSCSWLSTDILHSVMGVPGEDWMDRYREVIRSSTRSQDIELDVGVFTIGPRGLQALDGTGSGNSARSIRILGTKCFAMEQYESFRKTRGSRLRTRTDQHKVMMSLLKEVAKSYDITEEALRSGRRGKVLKEARQILINSLVQVSGIPQADLASFLHITQSAVSHALRSGGGVEE